MKLIDFLLNNAVVFDHGWSFFTNHGHYDVRAWVIPKHCVEGLEKTTIGLFHKCKTKTNLFYTTEFGLVYVSDTDMTDQIFKGVNLTYLYPDTVRRLLDEKIYYKYTPMHLSADRWTDTNESLAKLLTKREENKIKDEQNKIIEAQKKQLFIEQTLNGLKATPDLLSIINQAWVLDLYYDMSDCINTYLVGKKSVTLVYDALKNNGLNQEPLNERFKKAYKR